MCEANSSTIDFPAVSSQDVLTDILRAGAQQMLVHANKRWELTFSTYFTSLPAGTSCSLRFYLDGTSAADNLRRDYRQTIVDLAEPLDAPEESDWVQSARTGEVRTPDKPSKTAGSVLPQSEVEFSWVSVSIT